MLSDLHARLYFYLILILTLFLLPYLPTQTNEAGTSISALYIRTPPAMFLQPL